MPDYVPSVARWMLECWTSEEFWKVLEKTFTNEEIQELLFGDQSDLDVDSDSGDEAEKFQLESLLDESSDDSSSGDESGQNEKFEKVSRPQRSRQKVAQSWMAQAFSAPIDIERTAPTQHCQEPQTPLTYFKEYFEDDFWEFAATRTNLYWIQTNGTTLGMTAKEAKAPFGMHIVMGNLKFPQARMYWAAATRVSIITDAMPRDRFFRLRNALHVCNNDTDYDESNRCWKVQALLDRVRKACLKIPRSNAACVDEQMIPFTGRTELRQYVRGKPNPTGLKNFVLADSLGRVLDFEIYQGATTPIPTEHKDLGIGGGIVMRLADSMPRGNDCVLCFDRFFTSVPLIERLLEKEMFGHGTVMTNRVKTALKSDKELLAEGRGSSHEKVSADGKLVVVKWMDTRSVTLLSSCCGAESVGSTRRYDKKQKKYVEVKRPASVRFYNTHKGGVDLNDFLISLYRIKMKTKKWPVKVIFPFTDLALVNSWLSYKEDAKEAGYTKSQVLHLLDFRMQVAEALIRGSQERKRRGLPYIYQALTCVLIKKAIGQIRK
ncbi:piggyBac transposable element-derived protein 3-like [Dermacentor albipictus]|uniref:piggyBac transposable element-derived protein 3-like n=1 Tax=Dermacentor albipictus TaxID=60249 RepID=UPI0031FC15DF